MSHAQAPTADELHGRPPRPADRRGGAGGRGVGDGAPGRIKPRKAAQRVRQPRVDPPQPPAVRADVEAPEPAVDPDDGLQPGGDPGDAGDLSELEAKAPYDLVKHPFVVGI